MDLKVNSVRGFKDVFGKDVIKFQAIEDAARMCFEMFGFKEIRTPIVEKTSLFQRGIGEGTDIVEKEMYTFIDRNGDSISLRPEATAGVIRAFLEHKLYNASSLHKFYTIGPMFRHERPQRGRLRQFHQINAEVIGSDAPLADSEIIWLAWAILKEAGLFEGLRLEINSLGCPRCRPQHRHDLMDFLNNNKAELCEDCRRRIDKNPLRVFDCKNEACKKALMLAPLIRHYWCPECAQHLGDVLDYLETINIPFVINPYLVRGLDYYNRTTFEIKASRLGAQDTVAAGGRYDRLIEWLGGPDCPAVGMAIGMERAILMMDMDILEKAAYDNRPDCFFITFNSEGRGHALRFMNKLRDKFIACEMSYDKKSMKAQMRYADRVGARLAIIIGEDEVDNEEATVKDMETHAQHRVQFDRLVEWVGKLVDEKRG